MQPLEYSHTVDGVLGCNVQAPRTSIGTPIFLQIAGRRGRVSLGQCQIHRYSTGIVKRLDQIKTLNDQPLFHLHPCPHSGVRS